MSYYHPCPQFAFALGKHSVTSVEGVFKCQCGCEFVVREEKRVVTKNGSMSYLLSTMPTKRETELQIPPGHISLGEWIRYWNERVDWCDSVSQHSITSKR